MSFNFVLQEWSKEQNAIAADRADALLQKLKSLKQKQPDTYSYAAVLNAFAVDGFDFSLSGDDYISDNCKQFLSLPGKELHTADMEHFDTYVGKVKVRPRMEYEGEPPFNAAFWAKIQEVLQQSRPPGLDDLRDREQLRAQGI